MDFGAKYIDFFWWGGRVLFVCLLFNLFHSIMIALGSRQAGFYTVPNQKSRVIAISISTSLILLTSAVVSILGGMFYFQNVRPLKIAQTATSRVFTDMDGFGTFWSYLFFVGWPLLLFLLAIRKHVVRHRVLGS